MLLKLRRARCNRQGQTPWGKRSPASYQAQTGRHRSDIPPCQGWFSATPLLPQGVALGYCIAPRWGSPTLVYFRNADQESKEVKQVAVAALFVQEKECIIDANELLAAPDPCVFPGSLRQLGPERTRCARLENASEPGN